MGKGSAPRPFSVPQEEFAANWDAIFKRKPEQDMITDPAEIREAFERDDEENPQ